MKLKEITQELGEDLNSRNVDFATILIYNDFKKVLSVLKYLIWFKIYKKFN